MKITFYGHACFLIEICGKKLLIDPFISGNPLSEKINIEEIKADYVLLTHAHQDHVLDTEAIAKQNNNAPIISNYEIVMYYKNKGLEGFPLNHGGSFKVPEFTAKYVRAIHSSSFADGTYGGEPGGFLISGEGKWLYVSGDTALTMDMKLIPMQCKLTASIFPIGDVFTMGIDDAILASDLVDCNKVIGCHYNTFPPIQIDEQEAKNKFEAKGKELILLTTGNSIEI